MTCLPGYYGINSTVNPAHFICLKCILVLQWCTDCDSPTNCIECDNGHYLDPADGLCKTCFELVPNCNKCYEKTTSGAYQCWECDKGFY